jgi:hypothetical protein
MKKITAFLLASICSLTFSNAFGMLHKHILYTKKYIRTIQIQKYRSERIKKLLCEDQFKAFEDYEPYRYEEDDLLKNLYLRNSTIIELLEQDIDDIKKKVKTLKEQQDRAMLSIGYYNTSDVEKIEEQLYQSFNINKETE